MPEQSPLSTLDLTKINPYGASESQLNEIKDALQKNVEALEQRYSQPNWFKIAAGFAKPQLGGFLASMGSASEAMGENVEKARESQLPVAQMRSQIAQTNLILGQNKIASEMVEERKRAGKPITAGFVGEVVARAPDSPVAKSLQAELATQQKQQEITAALQRNALTAMAESRQAGLEVSPDVYRQAGLLAPGEVGEPGAAPGAAPGASSVQTIPGGARVNEQQAILAQLGVPIISGVRTQEEQDALKHHKDEQGRWRTEQGLPVADVSKHTSGQAVDVDSSKLTDEHRGMLKAMGYRQTDPKGDPNHWEKSTPGAGAAAPAGGKKEFLSTGDYHFSPLYTQSQVAESRNLGDKQLNENATKRFETLEAAANPRTYAETQHAIDAMISTITKNPEKVAKVSNLLAQQGGGLMGGVLNAAEAGVGFSVSGLAGNIHAPVYKALIGTLDPNTERPVFEALNTQAARIAKMQQQMNNVNPGTIRTGEIELYNNASVDPYTQGPNTMLYYLQYTKLNNEMLHEMYNRAVKIRKNQDPQFALHPNSRTPMMDIMTSPAMEEIASKYDKRFQKLDSQFQSQLGGR